MKTLVPFLLIVTVIFLLAFMGGIIDSKSQAATHNYEAPVMLTSAARVNTATGTATSTATGSGNEIDLPNAIGVIFELAQTSADNDSTDKLDVYIQTKIGDNWVDVVHFTQIDGNGTDALTYYAKIAANLAQDDFEVGTALTESNVRHLMGRSFRARWVIIDSGDGDASFTFSVTAVPL